MSELPGFDAWLTHNPDDDRCEYCGADPRYEGRDGWKPQDCTGECRRSWRDPDAEYDAMRDDRDGSLNELGGSVMGDELVSDILASIEGTLFANGLSAASVRPAVDEIVNRLRGAPVGMTDDIIRYALLSAEAQ